MRIISLEPDITALLVSLDMGPQLVGVTAQCVLPKELAHIERITYSEGTENKEAFIYPELCPHAMNLEKMNALNPDLVVASLYKKNLAESYTREDVLRLQANLSVQMKKEVKLASFAPRNLEEIYSELKSLTNFLKIPAKGIELSGKVKAQIMNWADNFYDRIHNKKVSFISSIEPLQLAGFWIPDMINILSAHSQVPTSTVHDKTIKWEDIAAYKPDVIIVAPRGYDLKRSMATFKLFEKMHDWDAIPAVKRGEVIFAEGIEHFYRAGVNMIDSMAILVSAIAGFESGYITPRDTFFRLRWLELQRHKL